MEPITKILIYLNVKEGPDNFGGTQKERRFFNSSYYGDPYHNDWHLSDQELRSKKKI